MKIQTKLLRSALSNLKPLFGGKANSMIYASNVKLHSKGSELELTATNLDEWAVERLVCDGAFGPICVNFNHLNCCLGGDEVEITMDGSKVKIAFGKTSNRLPSMDADTFPAMPDNTNHIAQGVNCAAVADGIDAVKPFTGDDATRPIVTCIHISAGDTRLTVESTDGRTLARFNDDLLSAQFDLVVPGSFCARIAESLRRTSPQIRTSSDSVVVEHDDGWYRCKLFDGKYMNTDRAFDLLGDEIGEINCAEISPFLQTQIEVTPPTNSPWVTFRFTKKSLELSALTGSGNSEFDGEFSPYEWAINAKYALAAIKSFRSEKCQVNIVRNGLAFQNAKTCVLVAGRDANE